MKDSKKIRIFWSYKLQNLTTNSFKITKTTKIKRKKKRPSLILKYFMIFYTFDELLKDTSKMDNYLVEIGNENPDEIIEEKWWMDLDQGTLLPGTKYWFRIDAHNADKNGAEGNYFECVTPTCMSLFI